jgi:hypothetical protein
VISTAFNLASSSPFFSAILAERGIYVPVQQMPHEISFLEAILTRNLNCRERLRDVSARPSAKRTELIKCLGIPDKIMLPGYSCISRIFPLCEGRQNKVDCQTY